MTLFEKVKGWFMNLLPIKDDVFRKFNLQAKDEAQNSLIEEWLAVYQNGGGLAFPAVVCWDLAKKALGELEIRAISGSTEDKDAQSVIDTLLEPNLRGQLEYALALGGVVARPWYDTTKEKVRVGWYTADMIIPSAWDGDKLTGVVLIDQHIAKKNTYLKLESIQPIEKGWNIKTKLFKSVGSGLGNEVNLAEVPMWATIDPDVDIENTHTPPFVYMKTPWANNKVLNSPLGSSIYRDAMKAIEELEKAYKALCWEIESGERTVFVDDSMIMVDPKTGDDKVTQLEKKLYRKLSSTTANDLLEPFSPVLRVDELNAAIKTHLAIACMACHLDAGAYIYDQGMQAITATEVTARQQQTYGTLVDIQKKMVEPFIYEYLDTIRVIQNLYDAKDALVENLELSIDFGDSVLTDEQADRSNAQNEVTVGLRSKVSYLMEYRGMSEAEAIKEIERIKEETPVAIDFFGA